jgi:putative phosphoribosyl transferase
VADAAVLTTGITITTEGAALDGDLTVPPHTRGVVLFAHGSGSSRHSPRNRLVAGALNRRGLTTLLVDLLTADEEVRDGRTRDLRFDVGIRAGRLIGIVDWLGGELRTAGLRAGLFGANPGATHLFEEPGTLDLVAGEAAAWFTTYL